jgi:hypothetical protein
MINKLLTKILEEHNIEDILKAMDCIVLEVKSVEVFEDDVMIGYDEEIIIKREIR